MPLRGLRRVGFGTRSARRPRLDPRANVLGAPCTRAGADCHRTWELAVANALIEGRRRDADKVENGRQSEQRRHGTGCGSGLRHTSIVGQRRGVSVPTFRAELRDAGHGAWRYSRASPSAGVPGQRRAPGGIDGGTRSGDWTPNSTNQA